MDKFDLKVWNFPENSLLIKKIMYLKIQNAQQKMF